MSNKDQDAPTKSKKKFDKWYEKNKERILVDKAKSQRTPREIKKASDKKTAAKKPIDWAKYNETRRKKIQAYSDAFDATVTKEQQEFMLLERKYHEMLKEETDTDMKKHIRTAYFFVVNRLQELAEPVIKRLRDESPKRTSGDNQSDLEVE